MKMQMFLFNFLMTKTKKSTVFCC